MSSSADDDSSLPIQPLELPTLPERYCLRCQEQLPAVTLDRCFRCRLPFDPERPETFLTVRRRTAWRFWLPGFLGATISGVVAYALLLTSGEMGLALFFAVPISFGAILAYAVNVPRGFLVVLAIAVLTSVVVSIYTLSLAGIFCGCTLWFVMLIPLSIGILIGYLVRQYMKSGPWDQRWFLPLIAFGLLPYVSLFVETRFPRRTEIATVQTELTLHATPGEAWNAIMFYEDVRHEPPFLMKLVMPRPLRSEGDKRRVGEVVRCFYNRGTIAKRISRVEPERRLLFDVVEQNIHFEHDVALRDGGFELIPLDEQRTLVRLTTRYQRLVHPRFVWEPIERHVVRTLHLHVLEGMRRDAEAKPSPPSTAPDYSPPATTSPRPDHA